MEPLALMILVLFILLVIVLWLFGESSGLRL